MTVLLKKTQPSCHLYKKTNPQKKKKTRKIKSKISYSTPSQYK